MTVALQAAAAPSISRSIRNPTLREALADIGVTVIPNGLVRAHKREIAQGEWGAFEPLITFLDRLLWIPRLYFVTRFIEWATGRQLGAWHATLVVLGFAGNFFGPFAGQTWSWLLMVPLLASIPSIMLYIGNYYVLENRWREMGSWRHTAVRHRTAVVGSSISDGPNQVPEPSIRLEQRAERALKLGRARVLTEYRGSDPFLIVVDKWNPFSRAYIGAYLTGNDELDNY